MILLIIQEKQDNYFAKLYVHFCLLIPLFYAHLSSLFVFHCMVHSYGIYHAGYGIFHLILMLLLFTIVSIKNLIFKWFFILLYQKALSCSGYHTLFKDYIFCKIIDSFLLFHRRL